LPGWRECYPLARQPGPGRLSGRAIVANQGEVDDLLPSLGF
jgi:chemotaxis regulatin CheY-phosphate phosphatase CheZ